MSTEVATTAIAPVDTPVMETATLAVEEVAATPAVEEVSVPQVAPAAPLATPKRSPFGDLKNKFFAKVRPHSTLFPVPCRTSVPSSSSFSPFPLFHKPFFLYFFRAVLASLCSWLGSGRRSQEADDSGSFCSCIP